MTSPTRPVVLVTWPDYDVAGEDLGEALARAGLQLRLEPKRGARTAAQVLELVDGASAAIVSTDPFDADVIEAARALRVIARVGVGTDSVDLAAATARGIAVTITPGANEATVADHAIGLMLALTRRLSEHDAGVRAGRWNRTGRHVPGQLTGATVGLVGYGAIGRRVAERLRGFGVRILVADPVVPADADVEVVALDDLLGAADIISLHAPLLPTTRSLIGARELALVRPGAILVNTARGGVVDEGALVDALREGRLAAAGIDVFAEEPPAGSPLLGLPNVLLTPHLAGLSVTSLDEMLRRATASVIDVLAGRRPRDLANPAVRLRGEPALGAAVRDA